MGGPSRSWNRTALAAVVVVACLGASAGTAQAKDRVYWSNGAGDTISSANMDGSGAGENLNLNLVATPTSIAFDPARGRIYWANWASDQIVGANLGDPSSATALYGGFTDPFGVQLDAASQTLYWVDSGGHKVLSAPADGNGPVKTLFDDSGQLSGLAIDVPGGNIYWEKFADGALNTGEVSVGAIDGSGSPKLLYSVLNGPTGLAIDPTTNSMWVTLQNDNTLVRGTLDGSVPLSPIGSAVTSPQGVAADLNGGNIFWSNNTPDSIAKATLTGDGASVLSVSPVSLNAPIQPTLLEDPNSTTAPVVSGTKAVGSKLSCGQGGWAANLPGAQLYQEPRSFSYQWRRNGTDLPGKTDPSLVPNEGGSYECAVTATNYSGSATRASAASVVGSAIVKLKPSPKTLPRINHDTKLKLSFRLQTSASASVRLTIQRKYGRKKGKCRTTQRNNVRRKRCTYYRSVMSQKKNLKPGSRKFTIPASTVKEKLRSGAYRASMTATTGGVTSTPARVLFYVSWK